MFIPSLRTLRKVCFAGLAEEQPLRSAQPVEVACENEAVWWQSLRKGTFRPGKNLSTFRTIVLRDRRTEAHAQIQKRHSK